MPSKLTPLLPSLSAPTYQPVSTRSAAFGHNFLRGSFTLTTWLLVGAFLQILLFLLPLRPTYTAAPVLILLSWQIIDHLLMIVGLKEDVYLKRSLKAKYTALFPDEHGGFSTGEKNTATPGGQQVCVFLLGFSCNHVLGPLAPGYSNMVSYAQSMMQELERNAAENGLLTFSFYTNSGAHTTGSELTSIYYFRDMSYVHKFAESELHRKGWDWFNKNTKQYPHLGIMHELYQVPAGGWENIYKNWEPSLFATAQHRVTDENRKEKWISGIVDARGRLKASSARLGLEEGEDVVGDNYAKRGLQ